MKLFTLQAVLFAILIFFQNATQFHWVWTTVYWAAVAWIWVLILAFIIAFACINHPYVRKKFPLRGDAAKISRAKRFVFLFKDWMYAMIWLVVLDSPYMAMGQMIICALTQSISSSLLDYD
jgi:hypothetical protein